jgi:RNA polymerase sigma factor (TIGR02999 family)
MDKHVSEDVTTLLHRWHKGDSDALNKLMPLVYGKLQKLARRRLRAEHPDHSIHTGTLTHEALMRLMGFRKIPWSDRVHFFSVAVREMRRVLIVAARTRQSQKRGRGSIHLPLDEADIASREQDQQLIALDEALDRLKGLFPRKCDVLELHYFLGLSTRETAEVMGISVDVVKSEAKTGKMWLKEELRGGGGGGGGGPANGSSTGETD